MSDPLTGEFDGRFGSPGATPHPWADVVDVLDGSEMFWLSTTRRDGRPHVTPLPGVWTEAYVTVEAGGHDIAHVIAVVPTKVLAFGKGEPFSQTRSRF